MAKTLTLAQSKRRKRIKNIIKKTLTYILLSFFGIIMVLPFVWMVSTSLKSRSEIISSSPLDLIPQKPLFKNYIDAWKAVPFGRFFINSIVVAVSLTFAKVITSSLAAYAFARLKFPGRDQLFLAYLGTLMIPTQVTVIPLYILIRKFGWLDTYWGLILPGVFTAYGTFLLRQFFLTIPTELEEAALIDGCSRFGIYWRIILPLSKPALATLSTFVFMGTWNTFLWPLIVVKSMHMRTLPIGLAAFRDFLGTDWSLLMAGSVIVLIPVLIVYIFNQRFFTKGIVLTGIKG